jgi:uncharacterized protein YdhG (YjbR/CyaY superfamily)
MKKTNSVDEYIRSFPKETQLILEKMREVIKKAAPLADETIGYGIPTYKLNGNLVHFGAYKNHIGFYPAPRGIDAFKTELEPYLAGKGTIKFPIEKSIPFELVAKIVKFRVKENTHKS